MTRVVVSVSVYPDPPSIMNVSSSAAMTITTVGADDDSSLLRVVLLATLTGLTLVSNVLSILAIAEARYSGASRVIGVWGGAIDGGANGSLIVSTSQRRKLCRMYYFLLHLSVADVLTALLTLAPEMMGTLLADQIEATLATLSPQLNGGQILCRSGTYLQMCAPYLRYVRCPFTSLLASSAFCRLAAIG